ncbi:unnamed protein product, partial [Musa banksii]
AGSIRNAEETCVEDATSGECAAAWDEVEELSAAVSHDDPLERLQGRQPRGRGVPHLRGLRRLPDEAAIIHSVGKR